MRFRRWLQDHGAAYLFALVGVALAAAVRYRLGPVLGGTIPVVLFTVPVVWASLYGGFWPGIFCTLVSAVVSDYLFIEPYGRLGLETPASVVVLLVFLAIGLTISYFGQRIKNLQTRLSSQATRLAEVNGELALANQRKDEFLAMLAHELRNPLAGISTAGELLKFSRLEPQRLAQMGEVISRQVGHMTKLVDDLLDVSRVTRGLVVIEKKPVDLKEALDAAVEQVRAALKAKEQQLKVQVPVGHACVCGDRTRLTQVISNLLANSSRYSPAGTQIEVRIDLTHEQVNVAVTDAGQGIDADLLPKIFDLFVQAERSIDRAQGGLGIGLALVKKIVELHEGTVAAHSEGRGRGSRFTISLPRLKQRARQDTLAPARDAAPRRSLRVLVVDDNQDVANATALLLEAQGHTVLVEYSARAALDVAQARALDAVILDIGLPEQDGRQLCRHMKALPHLADTVFIAISGYGQESDVALSLAAGFHRHFAKPVHMAELVDTLAAGA
ncbi:MAG: ATP-binding protein [Gammaproteobacteria bacterium]